MSRQTVQALKAHVAINVRNVSESVDFYRKMFGTAPSKVRHGYTKFDLTNPPLNFTLNETPFSERGTLSHLGIQVASSEDVLAVRKRWIEQSEDELPGHALMENRHGSLVDTMVTLADGGTRRGLAHGLADFGCEAGDIGWRQEL